MHSGPQDKRALRQVGAAFSKADLKRAIMVVEESGHTVHAVEFPPGGGFKLILAPEAEAIEVNEWDVALGLTDSSGRPLPQREEE